ncbi:MAG: hypothetical protein LBT31_03605, partial [Synergistaceae bacterium]|nr:hypothetical protein [Synergistaceae bacterium]
AFILSQDQTLLGFILDIARNNLHATDTCPGQNAARDDAFFLNQNPLRLYFSLSPVWSHAS